MTDPKKANATAVARGSAPLAEGLVHALEHEGRLDPAARLLAKWADLVVPAGRVRDLLHGVPIGHPAHPAFVQAPLGFWMSANLLDLMPGTETPAMALIGAGVVAAVPAALSGQVDFARLPHVQQRVGVVHWAAVAATGSLYGASLVARLMGHRALGKQLALAGLIGVSLAGYLGGHLAYRGSGGAPRPASHS
ncbi:MAG: hypothetical protein FWD85_05130 [Microbacteriaceae bacterium]|nr:hypothetical protein [Microbacteriaceae bacterium]MCL2794673.1 hypothetical protein [Microbacteriaceae bacterium]